MFINLFVEENRNSPSVDVDSQAQSQSQNNNQEQTTTIINRPHDSRCVIEQSLLAIISMLVIATTANVYVSGPRLDSGDDMCYNY